VTGVDDLHKVPEGNLGRHVKAIESVEESPKVQSASKSIDLGSVEGPPKDPLAIDSGRLTWSIFVKQFQIKVLLILCLMIIVLLGIEIWCAHTEIAELKSKDYISRVLTYVLPLFTFVLGMGTRGPDNS